MSPLRAGRAKVIAPSADSVSARASALLRAVELGGAQLDPQAATEATQLVEKVGERSAIAGNHTVVALAGATGSGKSSLFNALVGAPIAEIGARRPTTSAPSAAVWGGEPAGDLLDWLSISRRHEVPGSGTGSGHTGPEQAGRLDGLVLLDLPDFDSCELSHRAEAERVLALCDVFVWVADPQKYADALLHHEYVRVLAGHASVMIVVLNQVDLLTPEAVEECRADLSALFAADGAEGVPVLTTSAVTGQGIAELRQRLANAVAGHEASRARLAADLTATATRLRREVADTEPVIPGSTSDAPAEADERLVGALSRAAGVPVVLSAVEEDYRREAYARCGWIFTRWGRQLRPDPLRRLRLDKSPSAVLSEVDPLDVRQVLGRSSIPAPSHAARAAVRLAALDLTTQASEGLPVLWSEAVADAATPPDDRLFEALDRAVVSTPLRDNAPGWWRFMGSVQWLFGAAAVVGFVWLMVLAVVGWLQLPTIDTPKLGGLPWPFLLFAGGLVLGLLAAWFSRWLAARGARHRRAVVAGRLQAAVADVAKERLVAPVDEVLRRHRSTREQLDLALGA